MHGKGPITVLTVAFNHQRYIGQFVESLRANLQDIGQIVFVDNGSHDSTLEAFQAASAEVLRGVDVVTHAFPRGTLPSWSLNLGLNETNCPYVTCISADDYFLPDRFRAELDAMERDPAVQFVLANGAVVDDGGARTGARVHGPPEVELLNRPPAAVLDGMYRQVPRLFVQTGLYRTEFLRRIGGWDDRLIIDDWVLNIKAFRAVEPGGFAFIDSDVVAYRRHGANASKRVFRQYKGQKQVIERWLPPEYRNAMLSRLLWSLGDYWLRRRSVKRAKVFYGRARRAGIGLWTGVGITTRRLAARFGRSSIT